MKNIKLALIRLCSLLGGFSGGYVIALKYPFHEKLAKKLGMDSPTEPDVEECKKRLYIYLHEKGNVVREKNPENENDVLSSNNSGSVSDNDWAEDSKQSILRCIQNEEYQSISEANENVDGPINLVNENDLTDEKKENALVSISSFEFMKAYENGKEIRSLIFNPIYKTYAWDITQEVIRKEDLLNILNTTVINDIANESQYNAYGWIQTRYYYDSTNDVYVTVKTMLILP
jgi:hypothetical protein